EPLIGWDWVASPLGAIAGRLGEHLLLTGLAVGIGFALSFLLSIRIVQQPRLYTPVTWVTGVLYTLPSLALFALLVPITGLSIVTAEIGLVSYTLLILIRNIVGGIQGVPADVRDAAIGMGYTPRQLLWRGGAPPAGAGGIPRPPGAPPPPARAPPRAPPTPPRGGARPPP